MGDALSHPRLVAARQWIPCPLTQLSHTGTAGEARTTSIAP
jgi:hypothetical protein